MLRLDATTKSLEVVLAGAITTNQLPVVVNWSDGTTSTYTGGNTIANTNGATAVTVVAAPAVSTIRDIDYLSVRNIDTATATVTVQYRISGTAYTLAKITLNVGDQLTYTHADGWFATDSNGARKTVQSTQLQGTATGTINMNGNGLTQPLITNPRFPVTGHGNSGTSAQAFDYSASGAKTITATGNFTLTITNFPTNLYGEMICKLINGGAFTITWGTTVTWVKPDGTETTSLATYLAALTGRTALQTSGTDQFVFWSYDGSTIYGKLI
jgi:plastocyanin